MDIFSLYKSSGPKCYTVYRLCITPLPASSIWPTRLTQLMWSSNTTSVRARIAGSGMSLCQFTSPKSLKLAPIRCVPSDSLYLSWLLGDGSRLMMRASGPAPWRISHVPKP